MSVPGGLSNLQLEILKVFQYELADNQLIEIKSLLAKYFASKATGEMDELWEKNNWSAETMSKWLNEDLRKLND